MQLFRKKSDMIEAIKWDGTNTDEVIKFAGTRFDVGIHPEKLFIDHENSLRIAHVGWWIFKEGKSDVMVMSDTDFNRFFEVV